MGYFINDLPHGYFNYKKKTVFVYYNRNHVSFEVEKFKSFFNQFNSMLEADISIEGNELENYFYRHHDMVEVWRITTEAVHDKNNNLTIKPILYHEPNSMFFEEFEYDDEGHLIYKDGVYHNLTAQANCARPPLNFNVRSFIPENTLVPKDSLSKGTTRRVEALVVVDELGNVSDVQVKGIFDPGTRNEIENALMKMPVWKPAILNGRKVKVRTSLVL